MTETTSCYISVVEQWQMCDLSVLSVLQLPDSATFYMLMFDYDAKAFLLSSNFCSLSRPRNDRYYASSVMLN